MGTKLYCCTEYCADQSYPPTESASSQLGSAAESGPGVGFSCQVLVIKTDFPQLGLLHQLHSFLEVGNLATVTHTSTHTRLDD